MGQTIPGTDTDGAPELRLERWCGWVSRVYDQQYLMTWSGEHARIGVALRAVRARGWAHVRGTRLLLMARLHCWTRASAAGLLLTAALASQQACSDDRPAAVGANNPSDAAAAARSDAAANDRSDAGAAARADAAPYDQPETPGPCDQPDGLCRAACSFDKSPLCPGTQRCVISCESGAVAQYCREPDPSALALGEKCTQPNDSCREGGCMQEPRGADGPHCTAFCVVDDDCPPATHCVASSFSFGCMAGRQTFQEGLCRPLSVANR